MDPIIIPTAAESRTQAESLLNEKHHKELKLVVEAIKGAVREGALSVRVNPVSPVVKVELERHGYKTQYNSDPRDGESWTAISW